MNAPAHIRPEAAESPPEASDERMPAAVRRWARAADYLLEGAAIGLMIVLAIGISVYVGRRGLVADLAENYLERRGVEAEIVVEHVDSRGFIGRVRLGPADDPDFVADRVEVALAAPPPPEGPYALRPTAIRIVRPQLKGRWTGERLSFGSLDPLIDEALKRPKTDDPSPLLVVEDGALRLGTPYGLVRAAGSGVVDDARLVRLDLAVRPMRLSGEGFTTALGAARLRARVQGRTVRLSARAPFEELKASGARVRGGVLTLEGDFPYPDMERSRVDGPLRLDGALSADAASAAGLTAASSETTFRFSGDLSGPLRDPAFRGAVDGSLRTPEVRGEGWRARGVRVALDSLAPQDISLQARRGGLEAAGAVRVALGAEAFTAGDAAVQGLDAALSSRALRVVQSRSGWRFSGPARLSATASRASAADMVATGLAVDGVTTAAILQRQRVAVSGSARAQGLRHAAVRGGSARDVRLDFSGDAGAGGARLLAALEGGAAFDRGAAARLARQVPVLGQEPAYAGAIARALSDARISAPGLRLTLGGGRADAALTQAVRLSSASGARIDVSPTGAAPVFNGRGGAFRLAVRGGGLPEIEADISRYQLSAGGFTADLRARTTLDLAIAQGAALEARGRAVSRGGVFEFAAAECVRVAAATVELGENDLKDLSARLCPVREGALIRASGGGYRVRARAEGAAVAVPFLETRITNARGVLDAQGGDAGLIAVAARIDQAEADDMAAIRRYHPVALNGTAALAGGGWTAHLAVLEDPGGARLGTARVLHDQASGEGRAAIVADDLAFAPEGLQPHDLTPLGVGAVSKVQGAVDFEGEIAWNEAGATSRGRVATAGLDFDSPAGRVIGLKGDVALSSLTPLVAPAGQTVTADRVEGFLPIEDPVVSFALRPEALDIESAVFGLADGKVTVEPLTVPLIGDLTLSGAVQLDDVDVGQLIEATQFGDKVEFQAVVDGRVPFQVGPAGLRFQAGTLRSTRPGRVSINREVLSGVEATGGAAAEGEAPPSAFQDLAYDAMENLAYDQMEVAVDSRPGGRLGMIFTIRGRHDPPVAEEARISIFDLIRGKALDRDIPLPKGTPVNLTLDTSINFDELLAAYMDLNRARGGASAPVQP